MRKCNSNRELKELHNLGATIIDKLNAIGVYSESDLRKIGPAKAYQLLQKREAKRLPVCYYLYSLAGALKDVHWDDISEKEKTRLRNAVAQ